MPRTRREVELNEPGRPTRETRQHLVNASNDLFLYAQKSLREGHTLPAALLKAHAAIRAELRLREREDAADSSG